MKHHHPRQADLLEWVPPLAVVRFEDERVRAASVTGKICRGLAEAMRDCGASRDEISARMGAYLGEPVPKNMLDAYASEARAEHVINVVRFIALIHATGDRRLLNMIAEMFGWAVVPKKFLPLIELAALRDKEDELSDQRRALVRQARRDGVL